ncbi:hypothetical protein ES288_A01G054700v1 [Gossypium darwinii]|uniref:Uncharacterized protein n=2 Tax=Gossypium TaxID=3633 RepID=A0A5D2HK02_GOSDA|nr:hypothetical protein ES288_A01G054700v1 [Gossypium darwinii]TYH29950.1 hypothetical protein ES288_A01G054700v1 [Gossypium darwinii]TYI41933.1 hypothetical protein ES332_A01G061700v1 [Gossypium tomentosum]TYI41934.1 hypothetical protein ES332_A01G061700v1 [Gossypium tomentosum]
MYTHDIGFAKVQVDCMENIYKHDIWFYGGSIGLYGDTCAYLYDNPTWVLSSIRLCGV